MTKRLHHRGGKLAVYANANDGAIEDPLGNLDDLFFHSDLDYLSVVHVLDRTQLLPARPATPNQIQVGRDNLYQHNLGYVPWMYAALRNRTFMSTMWMYADGPNWRSVGLYADTEWIYLRELYQSDGSLPDQGVAIRAVIFETPPALATDKMLHIQGGELSIGFGKFDPSRQYLQTTAPGDTAADVYFTNGASADIKNGGLKLLEDVDTYDVHGPYNGTWTTSAVRGAVVP